MAKLWGMSASSGRGAVSRGPVMSRLSKWGSIAGLTASLAFGDLTGGGRITGRVLTEDGKPVAGAAVKAYRVGGAEEGSRVRAYAGGGRSGNDGVYLLEKLPAGVYVVCAVANDTDLLDSCLWRPNNIRYSMTDGQERTNMTIHLQQGFRLKVRLEDPAEHLDRNQGKSKGADVHVMMSGPFGGAVRARVTGKDKKFQEHEVVVPFDTPIKVGVNSRFFRLKDAAGAAVDTSGKRFEMKVSKREADRGNKPGPVTMHVDGVR